MFVKLLRNNFGPTWPTKAQRLKLCSKLIPKQRERFGCKPTQWICCVHKLHAYYVQSCHRKHDPTLLIDCYCIIGLWTLSFLCEDIRYFLIPYEYEYWHTTIIWPSWILIIKWMVKHSSTFNFAANPKIYWTIR